MLFDKIGKHGQDGGAILQWTVPMQLRCRKPGQDLQILRGLRETGFTLLRERCPGRRIGRCQFPVLQRLLGFRQASPRRLRRVERIAQGPVDGLFSLDINAKRKVPGDRSLQVLHDVSPVRKGRPSQAGKIIAQPPPLR